MYSYDLFFLIWTDFQQFKIIMPYFLPNFCKKVGKFFQFPTGPSQILLSFIIPALPDSCRAISSYMAGIKLFTVGLRNLL